MPLTLTRRARRGALAALLAGLLTLGAACSSYDESLRPVTGPSDSTDAGGTAPAAPAAPPTWPLTGLRVKNGGSAAKRHPVIVLKMDNTSSSAPQIGLGRADMVVEELVEGGLTRLAAFFYTRIPGEVGPVRSMRASDIGIVTPVHASVVTSGAAAVTIARIRGAGIQYLNEGSKGFYRDSSRYAPYNLFTNLRQTATLTSHKKQRPRDYLPFATGDDAQQPADLPQGQPAGSLVARFGSGHSTQWSYEGGHYVNDNSYAAAGDRFLPDNVLVLHVEVGDAGYLDPAGNPVPETKLVGSGEAELFHGGRRIRAGWSKAGLRSPIQLTKKGAPFALPAGHTWIELVPRDGGEVTYTP